MAKGKSRSLRDDKQKDNGKSGRIGLITFPPMTMKLVMDGAPDQFCFDWAKTTAKADPYGMTNKKAKATTKTRGTGGLHSHP